MVESIEGLSLAKGENTGVSLVEGSLLGRMPSGLLGSAGESTGSVGEAVRPGVYTGCTEPVSPRMAGDREGSEGVVTLLLNSWGKRLVFFRIME